MNLIDVARKCKNNLCYGIAIMVTLGKQPEEYIDRKEMVELGEAFEFYKRTGIN